MIRVYFLLVVALVGFGCQSDSNNNESNHQFINDASFELVRELIPERMSIPPVLLMVDEMHIVNDNLIILQTQIQDSIFYVFDLPDCSYKFSSGSIGRGPHEFYNPTPGSFAPVIGHDREFAISSQQNHIMYMKIKDSGLQHIHTNYLSPSLGRVRFSRYVGDSIYIGNNYGYDSSNLFQLNFNTEKLDDIVDYPLDFSKISSETKTDLFGALFAIKPTGDQIAISFLSQGEILIVNTENQSRKRISNKDFPSLKDNFGIEEVSPEGLRNIDWSSSLDFSHGVKVTNKYIFVSVFRKTGEEIFKALESGQDCPSEFHVFSWDGRPVARLILPESIFAFTVDETSSYLYAASLTSLNSIIRVRLDML